MGQLPLCPQPGHWLMAGGAPGTIAAPQPNPVWAEVVTLQLMARSITMTLAWFHLGMTILLFATLLRVGEASSIRPVDVLHTGLLP